MQATSHAKTKYLQTMRITIKNRSSPTTATSSGQDIQAHVGQSHDNITSTIRPRGEATVGPPNAVQPQARHIQRPRTPPPGTARHQMVQTTTQAPLLPDNHKIRLFAV